MKDFLHPFTNWRVNVLSILAMAVVILIASENESLLQLLLTKIAGIALGYITFRLGKYWHSKGKINELMALAEEE